MSMAAPPPIPGSPVDPPFKERRRTLAKIEARSRPGAILYRALLRFNGAHAPLLAAGTTYYLFLSLFSMMALAFGLVALLGSDQLSTMLANGLDEAFPGLVGSGGIDADALRAFGRGTSLLGMVALLYSGAGVMGAASSSLHLIYGAPKDPRNFVMMKARLLGWLVLIAPMLLISLTPSLLVSRFAEPVLDAIGVGGSTAAEVFAIVLAYAGSLLLNGLIIFILLTVLGGIRPPKRPRWTGAALGSVGIEVLRFVMASVVSWALAKPQYGAFAVPIAIMLVLFLQCLVMYFSAAVTAAMSEQRGGDAPDTMTVDTLEGTPTGPFVLPNEPRGAPVQLEIAADPADSVPAQRQVADDPAGQPLQ